MDQVYLKAVSSVGSFSALSLIGTVLLGLLWIGYKGLWQKGESPKRNIQAPFITSFGLILLVAFGAGCLHPDPTHYSLYLAAIAITLTGGIDDYCKLSIKLRLIIQFICSLVLISLLWNEYMTYWIGLLLIVICVGHINFTNFMDGINGLLGLYLLCFIASLIWILPDYIIEQDATIWGIVGWLVVFLIFNFRRRAWLYAGDSGSLSLGFISIYWILRLCFEYESPIFLSLFIVYYIDAIGTVTLRLLNGKNIFEGHQEHLYELLVYTEKKSHLIVSLSYVGLQIAINLITILYITHLPIMVHFLWVLGLFISGFLYLLWRRSK